jgi:hypothetical protein
MKKDIKIYAIKLFVKPKPSGEVQYMGKTFKGISLGINPAEAQEKAITKFLEFYQKNTEIKLYRTNITVKSCELFNHFTIN